MDTFVEVKGFERGPTKKKVNYLHEMGQKIIYADGEVLERDFKLNLSHEYLKGITKEISSGG